MHSQKNILRERKDKKMKKFNLAKIISLVFVCVMLVGALAITAFATEDEKVEILAANVYYGDYYKIAVAVNAPEGAVVTATNSKGVAIEVIPFADQPTVDYNGVTCKNYILKTGVAAQAIDEVFTFTVTYGEKTAYKNVSVLQYIYVRSQMLSEGDAELEMLQALLNFAIKADIFLDKTPADSSFNAYQYVKVTGATVNGVNPTGMYAKGATPFANLDAIEFDAEKYELSIKVNDAASTLDALKALVVADEAINVVVEIVEKTHVHNYTPKVTDPTCIAAGYTTYTCDGCGDSYTEAGDPATGAHVDNDGDFVCDTEGCEEDLTPATVTTIADVLNAVDGTPVIIDATVTAIDTVWNDQYENMSVYITDENGDTILCYRISALLTKGDIVTVTGVVGTHGGAKQIIEATAEINGHDTSYDEVVIPEVTIKEALDSIDGTEVMVTGTVIRIDTEWNSQYNNISVTIKDENGDELFLYRLSGDVSVKDTIKVTGVMATYNGARQVAAGATYEKIGTHECTEFTEATCTQLATCVFCGDTTGELADHKYVNGVCSCGAKEGAALVTVTTTIGDYAKANGWTNAVKYTEIIMDENITVTAKGSTNTGKYYTTGTNWRLYQTESATVTITATGGKTILSVKITYAVEKGGTITYNKENIASGDVVENINATSVTFGVGNSGTVTNGQARITSIEVIYA